MKTIHAAPLAMAAFVGWISLAYAAPPTATPSPGYDARLQEQRAVRAAPVVTPAARPRRARKIRTHRDGNN